MVGRFINADEYAATGQGILGNNMFAYCNNSPINWADYSGSYIVQNKSDVAGYGGGFGSDVWTIVGSGAATFTVIDTFQERITEKVKAKGEKKYSTETQEHHIVPRTAKKAEPARAILFEVYPGVGTEVPINKVPLSSKMHQSIHTNLYYGIVNYTILNAYYSADTSIQAEQNVSNALIFLRAVLLVVESAC